MHMNMTADEFNELYPVGTAVRYHSIIDSREYIDSKTRTTAWTLGHGAAVVSVNGFSGGVGLEALDIVLPPISSIRIEGFKEYWSEQHQTIGKVAAKAAWDHRDIVVEGQWEDMQLLEDQVARLKYINQQQLQFIAKLQRKGQS